ncbi:hypothetical protein M0813_22186 [Anaeramoeba flamelloides]|uniref:Uncharacterized protein n=1 Tax=Anaeramoeba flamelloides TaxID=1746091 RepID=A0ABQ8YGW1_9EUKA|nr:hypothetical protein M0813_22186 [Anaeramoeba flamelloides]
MDQQNLFTNYSRKRSLSEADSEIYPLTITTKLLTKPTTNLPQTLKQRRLVNKTQTLTNSETQQEITKLESKFDEISEKHNQLANRVQILISEKEQMKNELIQLRKLVQRNEIKQRNQLTKEKKKTKNLLKFLILNGHILPSSQKGKKLFQNLIKNSQRQTIHRNDKKHQK